MFRNKPKVALDQALARAQRVEDRMKRGEKVDDDEMGEIASQICLGLDSALTLLHANLALDRVTDGEIRDEAPEWLQAEQRELELAAGVDG